MPKILIGLNHFNLGMSTRIKQGAIDEPDGRVDSHWMVDSAIGVHQEPSKISNFIYVLVKM